MKVIVKTKMNVRMKKEDIKDKRSEKEKGKILWVR